MLVRFDWASVGTLLCPLVAVSRMATMMAVLFSTRSYLPRTNEELSRLRSSPWVPLLYGGCRTYDRYILYPRPHTPGCRALEERCSPLLVSLLLVGSTIPAGTARAKSETDERRSRQRCASMWPLCAPTICVLGGILAFERIAEMQRCINNALEGLAVVYHTRMGLA